MTEAGLQEVLVAIATLREQIRSIERQLEQMDNERQRARVEMDFRIEGLHATFRDHKIQRDARLHEMSRDISDINANLAGGTATRKFIVGATGVAAAAAAVIGVVASLFTH